jgi:HEAT repeat protein
VSSASGRTFGLEPGEGRTAGLMALHSLAMGFATVFFETAASALFVSRFGAPALPWVYVAAAFVNTGAGALFEAARARLAFRRLMAALLVSLLVSVLALRAGLALTEAAAVVFSLLVFYRVLSVLTDLEYWAVAGQLYDVRQAKRLFGLIGTGEVVARIAGSFAVPLLVLPLGVPNLFWLSAGALLLCLLLLLQVLPREAKGLEPRPVSSPAREKTSGFRGLLGHPYLRQLFALALFGVLAKHFVDFAFLAETREHVADVKAFASFFGLFSGLTQALSLLTRLFVSGPLLTRFGIRAGLFVLPAAHALCTAAILGAALLPDSGALVFWLVVGNQGLYKVLKHPIDNPCFKVLYQPLPRRERLSAQVAVETVVTPVTTGLAGAVMLLFAASEGFEPAAFAWPLLATFLMWTAAASKTGRAYGSALVGALRRRLVPGEALELGDEASRRAVEVALRSERPGDVLFALDLLERASPARAARALHELALHPAPEVRLASLRRLERGGDSSAAGLVERRLRSEDVPEVRAAALGAFVALRGEEAAQLVSRFLADPDERVRRAALAGLLRVDDRPGSPWRRELRRRSSSALLDDRLDAAWVIAGCPRGLFDDILTSLLDDGERDVRLAALQAAGRAGGPAVWPAVIAALSDRRASGAAMAALLAAGEAALPHLAQAFEGYPDPYLQVRLVRLAAALRAAPFLRQCSGSPDPTVRLAALEALATLRHGFGEDERPALIASLREEARGAAASLAAARDISADEASVLLLGALRREAVLARERALLWLAGVHDPSALARAREGLGHPTPEKRALALEVLDVTLSSEEKELVLPLCAEGDRRLQALTALFPQPSRNETEWLIDLLRPRAGWRPFVRTAALYTAARRGLIALRPSVEEVLETADSPLVANTAAFARAVLAGEASPHRKGRRMLTIEKVITLKATRMFEEASEEVLAEVAAILEEVEVTAPEAVFAKGDAGDSMYIIAEGRLRVSDAERTVGDLGPGDVFGELALLDPEPRLFTVAALEDSLLLRLDREAFLELMAGNIEIVRGVLHVLCERLRRAESAVQGS